MSIRQAYNLNSRLYVELIPNDEARAILNGIAYDLEQVVAGRLVGPLNWHVTVIHFGKVQDVYADLLKAVPLLSEETFLNALNRYAEHSKNVLPESVSLQTAGLDLFGEQRSVLVLRLAPTESLIAAHRRALEYLVNFFVECGLPKPEGFMRDNHNFQHAFDLKPHLTLVRKVDNFEPADYQPPQVTLQFLPASLAGI